MAELSTMAHNFERVSAFSPLLVCSEHFTDVHLKTAIAKMIVFDDAPYIQLSLYQDVLGRHFFLHVYPRHGKAMTGKWVIRVHVQRGIFFGAEKTGSELFYQFCPQDDRTGRVPEVYFEVLCQSMNAFCVVID